MSPTKGKKSRASDKPSIPEFFADKTVFITGGTGFLGKALIEKILRSCPDVRRIYLLMRPKGGKSLEQRVSAIMSLPVFTNVKRQNHKFAEKIVAMKGDVSEPNLGLSEEDRQVLIEEVSIVFHVAASVRFDDPLARAVLMNTRGTHEMVKLAQEMKGLESFLHVSTAYCNTHKDVIEEMVYPAPANWRDVVSVTERMDQNDLEVYSGKLLGSYPNSYTYTKALAEHVVLDHSSTIPVVIFRPTIVIASLSEPLPGWIDNFNGPVGLMVACGKGVVRSLYSDPEIKPDYMPVDVAVKAMIVAAWNRATSQEDFTSCPVYNCSANEVKRLTQREMNELGMYVVKHIPLNDCLWLPRTNVTNWKVIHYLTVFLLHFLPAMLFDLIMKLMKMKPILMKIQRKIFIANLALEYFLVRHWSFQHERCFDLNFSVLDEDAKEFRFNVPPDDFDVIEYYLTCILGARQYLLKEDNMDLPKAQKHYQRMYWVDRIVKVIFLIFMTYLAVKFQLVQKARLFIYFGITYLLHSDKLT